MEAILKLPAYTLVYRVVSRLIVARALDVFNGVLVHELLVTRLLLHLNLFWVFDSLGCVAVWIFIILLEISNIFFVFLWSNDLA